MRLYGPRKLVRVFVRTIIFRVQFILFIRYFTSKAGVHSISSPSHTSLLVHRTFNVSIPSNHIPQPSNRGPEGEIGEEWEYAIELKPETSVQDEEVTQDIDDSEPKLDGAVDTAKDEDDDTERGYWISSRTSRRMSGEDGLTPITFTVIGCVIAFSRRPFLMSNTVIG
jgi:DNA-directed RNA polymerase I subunit RPA43